MWEMGSRTGHPVWRCKECIHVGCPVGKCRCLLSDGHVMVSDGESCRIVSVCRGESYESLLKRLYGGEELTLSDKLLGRSVDDYKRKYSVDGVTDLTALIDEKFVAFDDYPVQRTRHPILVLKRGEPDYKYHLIVGGTLSLTETLSGVIRASSTSWLRGRISAERMRRKLQQDVAVAVVFHGGKAQVYTQCDAAGSFAVCNANGDEVDYLPLPSSSSDAVIELKAAPFHFITGSSFCTLREPIEGNVVFTVCHRKNSAKSIRERMDKFFNQQHSDAGIHHDMLFGAAQKELSRWTDEEVVAKFSPYSNEIVECLPLEYKDLSNLAKCMVSEGRRMVANRSRIELRDLDFGPPNVPVQNGIPGFSLFTLKLVGMVVGVLGCCFCVYYAMKSC